MRQRSISSAFEMFCQAARKKANKSDWYSNKIVLNSSDNKHQNFNSIYSAYYKTVGLFESLEVTNIHQGKLQKLYDKFGTILSDVTSLKLGKNRVHSLFIAIYI